MDNLSSVDLARDIALQKIGRNVVNFQKMEAMLKYLLAFGKVHGSLSELEAKIAKRVATFGKLPMGRLVTSAAEMLYAEHQVSEPSQTTTEASVSFSISLEGGKDEARMWRTTMNCVVRERNALIHKMLAPFDPRSLSSCERLCVELDAQRERILPAYAHLESLVLALQDYQKEEERKAKKGT